MLNLPVLALFAAVYVHAIPPVPASFSASYSLEARTQTRGCQQLSEKYPSLVFYSNTTTYIQENTNFYSASAILSPWCVFTPQSSQHVAGALAILRATRTHFGVRGGGHTAIAGAASTNNGVLIAMDKLNRNELGKFGNQSVAKIGSGQRWSEVYSFLEPFNLIVVGGRYAPVGVAGLLLGGGLSYFSSVRGWAADHILNYELVTADSKILQVNLKSYPDLFWALKGGSSNYGIVTRFDLETFPRGQVYAGFISNDESYIDNLIQAIGDFVDPVRGGILDPNTAIDASLFYSSETGVTSYLTSLFYNGSVAATPTAFLNFTTISTTSSTLSSRSFSNWLNETLIFGKTSSRKLWSATSLKSTPAAVKLVGDIFRVEVKTLRKVTNGAFTITWQPLTQAMVDAARANGGDAIDLDPRDGPIMAILYASDYTSAADDAYVDNFLKTLTAKTDAAAKAANLYYPFVFLNDAGGWQKTLSLYGRGKSFPRLNAVANKYDPDGVFQTLDGGAFKLSLEGGK